MEEEFQRKMKDILDKPRPELCRPQPPSEPSAQGVDECRTEHEQADASPPSPTSLQVCTGSRNLRICGSVGGWLDVGRGHFWDFGSFSQEGR